jgi:ankyrin repeat protein
MNDSREIIGQFIDAAVEDQAMAAALLKDHPEVLEGRWLHDETPLHFLAVEGFEDAVRFLAESGANVNATNCFGDTALIDVASLGNHRIATILLQHGADPDAKSFTRYNALDIAVSSGNDRLADLLLAAGARADYETDLGTTIADAVPMDSEHRGPMLETLARYGIRTEP